MNGYPTVMKADFKLPGIICVHFAEEATDVFQESAIRDNDFQTGSFNTQIYKFFELFPD